MLSVHEPQTTQYSYPFDEITNGLVVVVLDIVPWNTLRSVLVLFGFESQLNKDLLEPLVDEVDAQLLETVELITARNRQKTSNWRVQSERTSKISKP